MQVALRYILLLLGAVTLTAYSYPKLQDLTIKRNQINEQSKDEVLFLPNGQALQVISFDYKTLFANILWFNTVSYFGKHYRGDRNYTWLNHMCNLVTDLNSQAEHVFEFCSLMLAWEQENPKQAIEMLSKAINYSPEKWRYYYLRGTTKILFLEDTAGGHADFAAAAKLPQAPIFLARMASKTLSGMSSPEAAISFLASMVKRASNETEKEALNKHLKQTIHDYNLDRLERYAKDFISNNFGKTVELKHIVSDFEKYVDPFGGQYYWDDSSSKVKSTSGVARGKSIVKQKK